MLIGWRVLSLLCICVILIVNLWWFSTTTSPHAVDVSLSVRREPETPAIRAAVVYFPTEANKIDHIMPELRWFIESWRKMQEYEDGSARTDVVIVAVRDLPEFSDLGCTSTLRSSIHEPGRCIVLSQYVPLSKRDKVFKDYAFGDSIDAFHFAKQQGGLEFYNWLLRTDLDTFLTPAFATWKPTTLIVGEGGYCFDGQLTCPRLHRIAQTMQLAPKKPPVDNIGSTWYGPSDVILNCTSLTMDAMRYIHQYEFTKFERSSQVAGLAKNWPEWHYGVLLLYAGQVAINSCGQSIGFERRPDMLDFPTTSNESVFEHAHLHTWQNDELFSKFVFKEGGYDNYHPDYDDRRLLSSCHTYALSLALKSKKNLS